MLTGSTPCVPRTLVERWCGRGAARAAAACHLTLSFVPHQWGGGRGGCRGGELLLRSSPDQCTQHTDDQCTQHRLTDSAERWGGRVLASLIFYIHNNLRLSQGEGTGGRFKSSVVRFGNQTLPVNGGGGVSVGPAIHTGLGAISMKEDYVQGAPLHLHTHISYAGTRDNSRWRSYKPSTIVVARGLLSPMP